MNPEQIALMKQNRRFARQDYDKQSLASGGNGSSSYENCGPPTWDRGSWDAFKSQYGHYPYSAMELPPTFAGAPDWVYELCNLRKPPVTVTPS